MTAIALSPVVAPSLSIVDGKITTTSQQIAEHFGKRHADVIRAVKKLEISAEFTERNFALSEFTDSTGRKLPCYQITRDGFTLLAMGFTGKEAMQWKIAYLETFNRMEAELLAKQADQQKALSYDRINPNQAQTLKELVQAIVDSEKKSYGEVWGRLHNKFRVNSYLELPAASFEHACDYLRSKTTDRRVDVTTRLLMNLVDGQITTTKTIPDGHVLIDPACSLDLDRLAFEQIPLSKVADVVAKLTFRLNKSIEKLGDEHQEPQCVDLEYRFAMRALGASL